MGQSIKKIVDQLRAGQIRTTIRIAFSVFLLAAVLLPYFSFRHQAERSDAEQTKYREAAEQRLIERLLSPAGQLALLNPSRILLPVTPLRAVVLPFLEIQADMPGVVLDQVRAVGCPIQFKATQGALLDQGSVCVGVRKNDGPDVRGRLLVTGTFVSARLVPHVFVDARTLDIDRPVARRIQDAHRVKVTLRDGKNSYQWVFPVQVPIDRRNHRVRDGLSLTAYRLDTRGVPITRKPDFTGAWLLEGECINPDEPTATCMREHAFSIAIPRDRWGAQDSVPVRSRDLTLDVAVNGPNTGGEATTFIDSRNSASAVVPFGASDIESYLAAGESLTIERLIKGQSQELFRLARPQAAGIPSLQTFGEKVLRIVGIDLAGANSDQEERRAFGLLGERFEMIRRGSARGLDPELVRSGESVAAYAVLMIAMTAMAWVAIEFGIMRRVRRLTGRTRLVSLAVRADGNLKNFDFSALRGRDELGVLAAGLDDLLKRIADDVQRNTIRIQQERSTLRAIGHEIRGPLQSLSAILADSEPGSGYVQRMLNAVAALYGSASPSDGFQSVELDTERMDLAKFLDSAAKNAHHAGIHNVTYVGPSTGVEVRAEPSALEDVILHILQNATRYRPEGTSITIGLASTSESALITIHNGGPHIPDNLLDRIFEYGVSERAEAVDGSHGQGLFVAATYLSKMGGTISAKNAPDGVDFVIALPVSKG